MKRVLIPLFLILLAIVFISLKGETMELKTGNPAPLFTTKNHEGTPFSLSDRTGKWTVLYFYPKADTPGCTKQACAFRDSIEKIRELGAEVYGVSSDTVESLKKFHEKYHLNFPLLADPKAEIINSYEAKMPLLKIAKRWTFIVGPELKIRSIDQDVDPAMDAKKVAETIRELQKN